MLRFNHFFLVSYLSTKVITYKPRREVSSVEQYTIDCEYFFSVLPTHPKPVQILFSVPWKCFLHNFYIGYDFAPNIYFVPIRSSYLSLLDDR